MSTDTFIPRKQIGPFNISERKPKPRGKTKYVVTKDGQTAVWQEFGKLSTAVRWCKSQLPRVVPHVVIILEGGLCQGVISNVACDYTTVDLDAEQGDGDDDVIESVTIPNSALEHSDRPGSTRCYTHTDTSTNNPKRVSEILHAIELHEAVTTPT